MVILTIYPDNNADVPFQKTVEYFEPTLESAIQIGQKARNYYAIYDISNGRTIDRTEINSNEEDEWYYDEEELLWKKYRCEDSLEWM